MEKHNLTSFKQGWFLGNFEPSLKCTDEFEVAVKHYKKGDSEVAHFHSIATEWTVIVNGSAKMNDMVLEKDDIAMVHPGEVVKFEVLEDCTTVVVKTPCVKNDKYLK